MKQIRTRQVTRTAWQAFYVDENGEPTSDKVSEALCEREAKLGLEVPTAVVDGKTILDDSWVDKGNKI